MTTSPNDYGVGTEYVACVACGTKRPKAALAPGPNESVPRCADRAWCEAQIARREGRAGETWGMLERSIRTDPAVAAKVAATICPPSPAKKAKKARKR